MKKKIKTLRQIIDESLLKEGDPKAEAATSAEIAKTLQTLAQQFQKKSQVEGQQAPQQPAPQQPAPAAPVQGASVKTKEIKKKKKIDPDDDQEWK